MIKPIPVRHINTTQKEPNFSESFSVRDVQNLLAGKDMVQELHRHDFFYVLVLKKGKGHHEIDFTPFRISDNSVFFMRPGQVHQLTLKAGSTGHLIGFRTEFYYSPDHVLNQLLRRASSTSFYQLDGKKLKTLLPILKHIFQEYTHKQEGFREVIKSNLRILFIELVRHNRNITTNDPNTYAQERLEAFFELLELHISSHKQTSHYANLLNLSPYQLNAITKATVGKTTSELINDHIILESKRYLLATSSQVNQIAYHLGYEDVSYFIRFFKKHTGHSPDAFRHDFR